MYAYTRFYVCQSPTQQIPLLCMSLYCQKNMAYVLYYVWSVRNGLHPLFRGSVLLSMKTVGESSWNMRNCSMRYQILLQIALDEPFLASYYTDLQQGHPSNFNATINACKRPKANPTQTASPLKVDALSAISCPVTSPSRSIHGYAS